MVDYYLEGEEKFGPVTSLLYLLGTKIPTANQIYRFVTEDLSKIDGSKLLLDVGTGPGDIPIMLMKAGLFKKIYAVDPSKSMVNIAGYRSRNMSDIHFGLGSSRSVPFKMKFDVIFTVISFHHWQEKAHSLRYLKSLLKRGGEIRIYEYKKDELRGIKRAAMSHAVSEEEIYKVAKESGLKVKSVFATKGFIRAILA